MHLGSYELAPLLNSINSLIWLIPMLNRDKDNEKKE